MLREASRWPASTPSKPISLARAITIERVASSPAHAVDGVPFIPADIGTAAGVETVISRLAADWGGLDILVSNAGGVETKPGGFEIPRRRLAGN